MTKLKDLFHHSSSSSPSSPKIKKFRASIDKDEPRMLREPPPKLELADFHTPSDPQAEVNDEMQRLSLNATDSQPSTSRSQPSGPLVARKSRASDTTNTQPSTRRPAPDDRTQGSSLASPKERSMQRKSVDDSPVIAPPKRHHAHKHSSKSPTTPSSSLTQTTDRPKPVPGFGPASPELQEKLKGIVDLSNTTDTTIHERWAPAVVHEVVKTHTHEIRHEVIEREIHTHDIYHRILPIVDVQVLPTKHFIPSPDGKGLVQIPADQIPGRTGKNQHWITAETVSQTPANPATERKFTARHFEGERDIPENTDSDGVKRSKTTWIHPPELETGAQATGQTVPFDFGLK